MRIKKIKIWKFLIHLGNIPYILVNLEYAKQKSLVTQLKKCNFKKHIGNKAQIKKKQR